VAVCVYMYIRKNPPLGNTCLNAILLDELLYEH
jgi:hypothetical protein